MGNENRPHVVLLGAGASCATLDDFGGVDKNGKKTSGMDSFISNLGFDKILKEYDYSSMSNNLEDIYSEIYKDEKFNDLKTELEVAIENYYFDMKIPSEPTVYDMLILSLTKKDCIATFNWDPLLVQAYLRAKKITQDLPQIYYLHGNVFLGCCEKDKRFGVFYGICPVCKEKYSPVPLLYPVKEKNYSSHPAIASFWRQFSCFLQNAYIFTIFGYSAPKSDVSAVNLIKENWNVRQKQLEQLEIIDLKPKNELDIIWKGFEFESHYEYHNNFYDSILSCFPRISVESLVNQNEKAEFIDNSPKFHKRMSWSELRKAINL